MSARQLSRVASLKEAPTVLERLNKVGIRTTKDVLEADPTSLMMCSGLSLIEVKSLIQEISEKLCPPSILASDLYQDFLSSPSHSYLKTGWDTMDRYLQGGIAVGTISEICGASSSGKTQLCLQLCARVVLHNYANKMLISAPAPPPLAPTIPTPIPTPTRNAPVVYYDLAGRVSAKRLGELLQFHAPSVLSQSMNTNMNMQHVDTSALMSTVLIKQPRSSQQLLEEVVGISSSPFQGAAQDLPGSARGCGCTLETLIIENNIQLVIIDNFSYLFRKENMNRRDGSVLKYTTALASALKRLASECKCAVVLTNTDDTYQMHGGGGGDVGTFTMGSCTSANNIGQREATGAMAIDDLARTCTYIHTLGPEWHHCVTTRLLLCNIQYNSITTACGRGTESGGVGRGGGSIRAALIEKHPMCSGAVLPFQIATGGLIDY